jgi:uncharacterized protein (TIGR03083 family)
MEAGNDGIASILPGLWFGSMSLDHLALLRRDLDQFAAAVATGPADAPIAGCPGWTLTDLGVHLGEVHRWVLGALAVGAPPTPDPADAAPTTGLDDLAAWLRDGGDRLHSTLSAIDPTAPTWHPFPVEPKVAGLWPRRQAHEASVHRWDAQHAIGLDASIDPAFAADGIDEYWTIMLPRMLTREQRSTPSTRIAVQTTDTNHRWVIDGSSGLPVLDDADAPVAGELLGPAETVLLHLWGRPAQGDTLTGDQGVIAAWLALGGS